MRRFGVISIFLALAFLPISQPLFGQDPNDFPARSPVADIVFLTGREAGTYFSLGRSIKDIVDKSTKSLQIICLPSMGSLENAALLEADRANLAIIQSDIAYSLYSGTRFFPLPSSKIKVISPLHSEVVHIVARRSSHISSIDDLEEQIVSVGEQGSGAEVNASMILASANLTYRNISPVYRNLEDSISLIQSGRIDAFFATTRSPSKSLESLLENPEYLLVRMKPVEVERIVRGYPGIFPHSIERNSYPNQTQPIPTISVRALLVVHSDVRESKIYQLTKLLFENKDYLKKKHPFLELDEKDATADLKIPLHPGARHYFIEAGILKGQSWLIIFRAFVVVVAVAGLFVRFFIKPPKRLRKFGQNFYLRYAVFFLSFVLIAAYGMYLSEKSTNVNFSTYSHSLWSCIVYLFSGFEDRAPITALGKILSVLIFLMGVSVVGIISGRFASFFINKTMRKEKKMPANLQNHIVVCHWNSKAEKVIEELFQSMEDTKEDVHVVLLAEEDDQNIQRLELNHETFTRKKADPLRHENLAEARVHKAKSVIILAKEGCPDADGQTALVALAVSQVCRDKAIDSHIKKEKLPVDGQDRFKICKQIDIRLPHIVADVVNHRKTQHLSDANVREIVCPEDYGIGLLAQSAIHPGLVKVYNNLLRFTPDGSEFYLLDHEKLPTSLQCKNFKEVSGWLEENFRQTDNPMILFGFLRNGEPILNPRKEQTVLQKDDKLIILAFYSPRQTDFAACEKSG